MKNWKDYLEHVQKEDLVMAREMEKAIRKEEEKEERRQRKWKKKK